MVRIDRYWSNGVKGRGGAEHGHMGTRYVSAIGQRSIDSCKSRDAMANVFQNTGK